MMSNVMRGNGIPVCAIKKVIFFCFRSHIHASPHFEFSILIFSGLSQAYDEGRIKLNPMASVLLLLHLQLQSLKIIGIRIYEEAVLLLGRGQLFDGFMYVATQEQTCADHKR